MIGQNHAVETTGIFPILEFLEEDLSAYRNAMVDDAARAIAESVDRYFLESLQWEPSTTLPTPSSTLQLSPLTVYLRGAAHPVGSAIRS